MGSFLETNKDLCFSESHLGGGIDKISEDVSGLGMLIAVANFSAEEPVETACHEREL